MSTKLLGFRICHQPPRTCLGSCSPVAGPFLNPGSKEKAGNTMDHMSKPASTSSMPEIPSLTKAQLGPRPEGMEDANTKLLTLSEGARETSCAPVKGASNRCVKIYEEPRLIYQCISLPLLLLSLVSRHLKQ